MFRFRLSKVLEYRRIREGHLKRDMLQKRDQLKQEETRLAALLQDQRGFEERLSTSQGTTLSGHEVQQWRSHSQAFAQRIDRQQTVTAKASEVLTATRGELMTAQQKKKVLEKLRVKEFSAYLHDRQKREQHFFDEVAIMRSHYGN